MMLKVRKLLFLFVVMCVFPACGTDSEMKFYLTNPSDESIQVEIDNQKYTVEPNGIVKLKLGAGVHSMLLAGSDPVQFKVFQNSTGGIINPTKSLHVVYTMVYIVDDKDLSSFMPAENDVLIDGVEYSGPVRTTDAMFIDNNAYGCTYFVGEPFPEEITLWDKDSKGNMKSKIFTKKEFIDFYGKEALEDENYHETNKVPGGHTLITENQTYVLPVADFQDKRLQEQANKIIATLKAYMQATDGSEQEKCQRQYGKELLEFSRIESDDIDVEVNKQKNAFIDQSSLLIGLGIVQL